MSSKEGKMEVSPVREKTPTSSKKDKMEVSPIRENKTMDSQKAHEPIEIRDRLCLLDEKYIDDNKLLSPKEKVELIHQLFHLVMTYWEPDVPLLVGTYKLISREKKERFWKAYFGPYAFSLSALCPELSLIFYENPQLIGRDLTQSIPIEILSRIINDSGNPLSRFVSRDWVQSMDTSRTGRWWHERTLAEKTEIFVGFIDVIFFLYFSGKIEGHFALDFDSDQPTERRSNFMNINFEPLIRNDRKVDVMGIAFSGYASAPQSYKLKLTLDSSKGESIHLEKRKTGRYEPDKEKKNANTYSEMARTNLIKGTIYAQPTTVYNWLLSNAVFIVDKIVTSDNTATIDVLVEENFRAFDDLINGEFKNLAEYMPKSRMHYSGSATIGDELEFIPEEKDLKAMIKMLMTGMPFFNEKSLSSDLPEDLIYVILFATKNPIVDAKLDMRDPAMPGKNIGLIVKKIAEMIFRKQSIRFDITLKHFAALYTGELKLIGKYSKYNFSGLCKQLYSKIKYEYETK